MTNQLPNYRKSISYYKSKGYDDFKTLDLLKNNRKYYTMKGGDGEEDMATGNEVNQMDQPMDLDQNQSLDQTLDQPMDLEQNQGLDQTMGQTSQQTQTSNEILDQGRILYHPSTEIKKFSPSMIFVNMQNVLDQSKQRSFTLFFTPSEEYARRYSGIWSLNKKPVYVHKLRIKNGVTLNIKKINANDIANISDNTELGKNICGDSVDGFINGMKVEHPTSDGSNVSEYYICNPSQWFEHVETWMQTSPTEWIKTSPENTQVISLNSNNNVSNNTGLDEGLATSNMDTSNADITNMDVSDMDTSTYR